MRANEFIKKFGWEVAKKNTEKCFDGKAIQIAPLYMLDDLKRYVDAYELVQPYMDRESGQWFFIADYCKKNRISPFDSGNYEKAKRIYLGAIADVESCQ